MLALVDRDGHSSEHQAKEARGWLAASGHGVDGGEGNEQGWRERAWPMVCGHTWVGVR